MSRQSLPPLRPENARDSRSLPPIQLPPIRPHSSIPITKLLCEDEQESPRSPQHAQPQHAHGGPQSPEAVPRGQLSPHQRGPPPQYILPRIQPQLPHPSEQLYSQSRSTYTELYSPIPRVSEPPPLRYILSVRQQPCVARACGFGERDRRVIDPPPILELKITSLDGMPEQDPHAILALHCTLVSRDGREDETEAPMQTHLPSTRQLMGTLVASPYQGKDEHGRAGTFFVFPDLSCRSTGVYRLRFKLLRIDPSHMMPGVSSPSVAGITTDPFHVFTAKDFPGMRASSALLKALRRQGLNVGVKKGSEARKNKNRQRKEESEDSASDDNEQRRQPRQKT